MLVAIVSVLIASVVVARIAIGRRWLAVTVEGNSMAPTFVHGERVMAARRDATRVLRVGDVIVFRIPAPVAGDVALRIKRVAAVAGEAVPDWARMLGDAVPAAHVVVSGDNPVSQDSRQLGFVPEAAVIAVVTSALHARA